jgi:Glu-tRNA(Gln) amidotransferase subunit E-like FAD-binding protein
MSRVRKVENDTRVRLGAATIGKFLREVDGPVEVQGTIRQDVNPLSLEVGWCIDDSDIASLDEVYGLSQLDAKT